MAPHVKGAWPPRYPRGGEPEPLGVGFALLLGGAVGLAFWAALAWWWLS